MPATQERGRVEQRDIAVWRLLAFEHVLQRGCVRRGIAAAQRLGFDPGQADIFGRDLEAADHAGLERGHAGRTRRRDFVEPVRTVHHPDAFGAENLENLRQGLGPVL